jgi:putative membrane protein
MMLMGYSGSGGWVGWLVMVLVMIVFWTLLIAGLVALVRFLLSSSPATDFTALPGATNAEDVLAERYARGEIDDGEYHRRLALIRQNKPVR